MARKRNQCKGSGAGHAELLGRSKRIRDKVELAEEAAVSGHGDREAESRDSKDINVLDDLFSNKFSPEAALRIVE